MAFIGHEPLMGGVATPIVLWAMQTEPMTQSSFVDQLPNYGIAGLIVGLMLYILKYFDGRQDKTVAEHKTEVEILRADLNSLKEELAKEREIRRIQEEAYLSKIQQLQDEITTLKVQLARYESR